MRDLVICIFFFFFVFGSRCFLIIGHRLLLPQATHASRQLNYQNSAPNPTSAGQHSDLPLAPVQYPSSPAWSHVQGGVPCLFPGPDSARMIYRLGPRLRPVGHMV